jgi:hypothetical protein
MQNKIFSPGGDAADVFGRRWLPAKSSLTIPAFSLVQGNGGPIEEGIDLIKPATKDMNYYGATGPTEISSTKRGEVSWSWPCWVKYTGTTPTVGVEVGVAAGSHSVTTAGKGYRVLIADTGGLLVLIVPFGKSGGTCGNGDCPDSCLDSLCFAIDWVQGVTSGTMYFPMSNSSVCVAYLDSYFGTNIEGSSGNWYLVANWDGFNQILTLDTCATFGLDVNPDFGATESTTCGDDISYTLSSPGGGNCTSSSTYPCCE